MTSMARIRNGIGGAVALAAALLLAMAPALSSAQGHEHAHGGFGGYHGGGYHGGGYHGGGHYGGPRYAGQWAGRAHYAVPEHWVGMHPRWEGPRGGYWARPWGPHWVPHTWGGGYWGGRFWPHVYLGWDFPWFLTALPIGYSTYWWGGVPYYYWQGVYYNWSPDYDQYVVTDPPPLAGGDETEGAAPPPGAQAAQGAGDGRGAMSLFVYPKQGQSDQQTQSDRYQCHQWAVGQTGFDPTNTADGSQASTATPENYKRAVTACLEARGYSVK
jgi:hypothetical protein